MRGVGWPVRPAALKFQAGATAGFPLGPWSAVGWQVGIVCLGEPSSLLARWVDDLRRGGDGHMDSFRRHWASSSEMKGSRQGSNEMTSLW